ncbi:MAG TPA: VWA domain-containing protein, partial [Minicystis sp.]|nr:VWA domain-containing protein [Minicystis sp.]
ALWRGTFGEDRRVPRLRIGTIAPLRTGPRGARTYLRDVPGVLRAVALTLFVLALARPVSVLRDEHGDEKGIDIVLVMDLSGSMRAVLDGDPRDLPGSPQLGGGARKKRLTRLDTAKLVVRDFIRRRKSDRIGVIVFGTNAYVLSPPTLDYQLLDTLVDHLGLNVIDGNQTAIGDAVGTAVARLRRSDARSKVVILLTDGDNNAGMISPEFATHLATKVGAKLYTIQIGNDDEVEVEDGMDLFGQPHYVKHRFPVNPKLLKWMAKETGGQAFIATDGKALAQSMHEVLNQLEKTRFEASIASFEDLFPWLVVPGVVLVALDALLRAWVLRRFP